MSKSERTYRVGPRRLRSFDYADPAATYFVTLCVHDRHPVFNDAASAQVVIECLHWLRANRGVALYAFCLMPGHVHLLIRPGQLPGDIIRAFKTYTTRQVQRLGRPGKLWQDDYYEHIVRMADDGWHIARYILENPVRKGLVGTPEAYPWSDLPDPM